MRPTIEAARTLASGLLVRYFSDFRLKEFLLYAGAVYEAVYEAATRILHASAPNAHLFALVVTGIAAVGYIRNPKKLEWAPAETAEAEGDADEAQ
jgi:hypothetical protein